MILLLNVMRNNKLTARIFLTQKRINLVVFFSSSSSPERDEAAVVSFSKSRSHEIVFFFYNVIRCNRPQNVWCGCCCFLFCFFCAQTTTTTNWESRTNSFQFPFCYLQLLDISSIVNLVLPVGLFNSVTVRWRNFF